MLIGIAQGAVLGSIILLNRDNRSIAGKLVALILLVLTLATLGTFLDSHFSAKPTPVILWLEKYFPFYLIMLLGPSIYLLVKSQLVESFRLGPQEFQHYYAVLFNLIPLFTNTAVWVAGKAGITFLDDQSLRSFFHYFYTFGDVVFWLHISTYLILSKKIIHNYRIRPQSKRENFNSNWLNRFVNFFIAFQLIWFPYLLIYISKYNYLIWEYGLNYYYIYIPLVLLIYWISIKWLLVSKTISAGFINRRKSSTISWSNEEVQLYLDRLNNLMTIDRAYLNPSLSLKVVAKDIGISSKSLSFLLNQHLGTNFNTFVNQFRVNEVKKKLVDPSNDHITIAAIAMNSGFKSIPTFQRSFKRLEQITPKDYKKGLSKNAQFQI